MKKLKKWMTDNNFTQVSIASKLKITPSGFSRYINKSRKMPLDIAIKIEKLTRGEIKCKDLV